MEGGFCRLYTPLISHSYWATISHKNGIVARRNHPQSIFMDRTLMRTNCYFSSQSWELCLSCHSLGLHRWLWRFWLKEKNGICRGCQQYRQTAMRKSIALYGQTGCWLVARYTMASKEQIPIPYAQSRGSVARSLLFLAELNHRKEGQKKLLRSCLDESIPRCRSRHIADCLLESPSRATQIGALWMGHAVSWLVLWSKLAQSSENFLLGPIHIDMAL